MIDGQRVVQQWIVRVDGVDLGYVEPGERVQIGRKPLRPLVDEGVRRLEVQDATRSMSKRHAMFSVADNGAASLRDLDSTNGSYVVRENGELMRIPGGTDFLLPTSPMRLQLGDVPVDFIRVERNDERGLHVPDLFGYALSDGRQEPDAADMSVDDILDLRAGEPTSMFDADQVRHRAGELNMAELRSYRPYGFGEGSVPLNVMPTAESDDASSRDLFADARAGSETPAQEPAYGPADGPGPGAPDIPIAELVTTTMDTPAVHESLPSAQPSSPSSDAMPSVGSPEARPDPADAAAESPLAASARSETPSDDAAQAASVRSDGQDGAATAQPAEAAGGAASAEQPQTPRTEPERLEAEPGQPRTAQAEAASDGASTAAGAPQDAASGPAGDAGLVFAPMDGTVAPDDDHARYARPQEGGEPSAAYTPAFEPGSVFDRVSKGEFAKAEPSIEVGGHTSDEAKRTEDFGAQYEMARHPQLLPFLAMNPSLYDDLYEWLAAQGDRDVDAALARNEGYQEYRKAVGK